MHVSNTVLFLIAMVHTIGTLIPSVCATEIKRELEHSKKKGSKKSKAQHGPIEEGILDPFLSMSLDLLSMSFDLSYPPNKGSKKGSSKGKGGKGKGSKKGPDDSAKGSKKGSKSEKKGTGKGNGKGKGSHPEPPPAPTPSGSPGDDRKLTSATKVHESVGL
jgi:hypothetical protein